MAELRALATSPPSWADGSPGPAALCINIWMPAKEPKMHASVKNVIERALKVALDQGVISSAEYDAARQEVEGTADTGAAAASEVGGYALIEFLYARAIEAGEEPPACAREWRELEVAMADCGPGHRDRFAMLQRRSHELAEQCRAAASKWSEHEDFQTQWAQPTS